MLSVIKSVGPKLVPFFKALVIYFVVFIPHTDPGFLAALLKCLPIISLMVFVAWHGKEVDAEFKPIQRKIFLGLLFSCIGDLCLIWPSLFPVGMISFTIGHVFYILAFGFKPFNLPVAIAVYVLAFAGCVYLMPGIEGILVPGVPIYSIALTTMMWRAIARAQFNENLWTWSKACTCVGAILFVISDLLIALDRFKFKIENDQVFIMSTYYAAQLGIALSIVDVKNMHSDVAKNKRV